MRQTQVFKNNEWTDINFIDLEIDDKIRYIDDGKQVTDEKGRSTWLTASYPYRRQSDGALVIDVY